MITAHPEKKEYDASCLVDFLHCPKLFEYRWVRRLYPIELAAPLLFGQLFHESLLIWYKEHDIEKAVRVLDKLPTQIGDSRRTKERGEVYLRDYIKRYESEPYKIKEMEVEFHLDMGEGRTYRGRMDMIVEWNGQLYPKDHKTSASLGLSFFRMFRPNVQKNGYCYACRELCGQCSGMIINGISVADNPKERFQRDISNITGREIDEFPSQFGQWCVFIEACFKSQVWPKYYTQCNQYGQCNYWELCVYGEDEKTLKDKFEVRKEDEGKVVSDGDG